MDVLLKIACSERGGHCDLPANGVASDLFKKNRYSDDSERVDTVTGEQAQVSHCITGSDGRRRGRQQL